MTSFFLGIAGGSGTGKSTLAFALMDKYPKQISVLHFDDYQKKSGEIPILHGFENWDHPEAIDFEELIHDLNTLKNGETITVFTWCDERLNPDYAHKKKRVPMEIQPKAVIILEGYLTFYKPEVREFLDLMLYCDAPEEIRNQRRTKLRDEHYEEYIEKILRPMYNQYLEPTKQYAHHVIDITQFTKDELVLRIEKMLPFLRLDS
ncbi:MAG TPA: hypothetical protein ENI19_03815 [Candidatus Nealsonbacteria bacterium]|uniref:Phosphoribulokinase/uridine kinase domain-containing protein n=1 Tax=marine sediment metagenome TaxID=412755 RepID=A0A0F9VFE9_9ZZZZ|nr:hypothetical protein [Candidatus Nealsonbacteria bacterium]HEB46797.1 hypothetical protein [Candidatus Nealsonbacteria bacterium]